MCGIAGEWDWSGKPLLQSVIAAMIDALKHRGPEGCTCWFSPDGTLGLAHAQLSFFKEAKAQPVINGRGTIFVLCNGEIYNHQELAALVRQSGINAEPRSDVEIIPYIYELHGSSSFAMLRGEFAIVLYDSEKQSMYLVRDRFGIKPLYYHRSASSIAFSSEIKALFVNPRIPRMLDKASIANKLCGITLPGSTAFSTIREVKPASYLEVSALRVSEQPYWSLKLDTRARPKPLGQFADDFLNLFDEAVRVRLHGDYPIGAYLSGGIDSSAVLASMIHAGVSTVKAFTIGFDDKLLDETQEATNTASFLGVEHHLVRVSDRAIADNFLHSIWHSEIPVINTHGTAKFILSRATSRHVKAIMTGEGADELFAGYSYFGANYKTGSPLSIRQRLVYWLLGSDQSVSPVLPVPLEKKDLDRVRDWFGYTPYFGLRATVYARHVVRFLSRDFLLYFSPLGALESIGQEAQWLGATEMTAMNMDRFLALRYDLPAYILNFLADRQEMAHSIEGRVPFLDDNVVALASTLADEVLIGHAAGKKLLRVAFAKRLPKEVCTARKKIFLAPPTAVDEILRSEWADHLLSRAVTNTVGIFNWKKVAFLKAAVKIAHAHSGVGTAVRLLLMFTISLHALHHLFVAGRARS
jgi:asparagine synthase (glutamine-hydrolysing)